MDKGYKYLQQQFDLNTESSRVSEKVLNNKVKKVYSTSDINLWIKIGVSKGFIEDNKDVRDWIKLLKDVQIDL